MVETSIIIPTYHRKESLLRLLDSFNNQITDKEEIIIVEQGENNGIEFRKRAKTLRFRLIYLFEKQVGTSRAKNIGAKQARGSYFVFFDDDVIVKKDCIACLIRNLSDKSIGIVGGRVLTPGQKIEENRDDVGRISLLTQFSDGFSSKIKQEADTIIGCNMAIRRDVFSTVNGFDSHFIGAFREESDLCLRVKKSGYKVLFEPEAIVTHMREPKGGARKTEGRLDWYVMFFSNETYFFLKHRPIVLLPVFLFTRLSYILRCMFGFGREVSIRSILTPWKGIWDGVDKFIKYKVHKVIK
jgi:GT2 family glycosyltransferase